MLIVPIENRPDWTKPPVITLALILINLAVFLFYQSHDRAIAAEAERLYREKQLLHYEREPYLDYLFTANPERWDELTQMEDIELQSKYLRWSILFDRGFDRHLREIWPDPPNERTLAWRHDRERFEEKRNQMSSYRGGLIPAEAKPLTFFTSLFLHGGWGHLLGNMVFLFLFGFTLEAVLRPHTYLLMYLASGLAANGLHMAFNLGSATPVIGASGAISGLMGMYLSLYRLRRIRLFYSVLFYFGEFRAPALAVLPLWLAKELYGYFHFESSTAYWAHIGGLITGALLMWLPRKSQAAFSDDLRRQDADDEVEQQLQKVQLSVSNLDFQKAKTLTRQICQTHPHDPRPWKQWFDLHKTQPQHKSFHQVTFELLKQFVGKHADFTRWRPHVDEVLREYQSLSSNTPALNGNMSLALARTYWRNSNARSSEQFLQRAHESGADASRLVPLLKEMIAFYQRRRQTKKATQLISLLKKLQQAKPSTQAR